MPPKTLRYWWDQYAAAYALACVYGVELSLEQFCAARLLEPGDRDELSEKFEVFDRCM
jgi:hypothetical protein